MSVLFGIVSKSQQALQNDWVRSMTTIASMGNRREILTSGDGNYMLGLALLDQDDKSRLFEDGENVCLFGGEYFGVNDLLPAITDNELRKLAGSRKFLFKLFDYAGIQYFSQLDGAFACIWFNRNSSVLIIVNDVMGLHPLFYVQGKDFFAFSSEYQILLGLPFEGRKLDYEAVGIWLTFGIFFNGTTPVSGLRNLAPATFLQLSASGQKKQRYFDWNMEIDSGLSLDDAIDEIYFPMQKRMIEKIQDNRIKYLPLSGGFDTRFIMHLLPDKLQRQLKWRTNLSPFLTEDTDKDVIIAKIIAEKFKLNHEIHQLSAEEQSMVVTPCSFFEKIRPLKEWFNVNGHFSNYFKDRSVRCLNRTGCNIAYLNNRLRKKAELFRDRLLETKNVNPNSLYFTLFLNETRSFFDCKPLVAGKWVNPTSFFLQCLRTPFIDASIYRILLKIPREFVANGRLFLKIMERHAPDLLGVPFVQNHFKALKDPVINKISELESGIDYQFVRKKIWAKLYKDYLLERDVYKRNIFSRTFFAKLWIKYLFECPPSDWLVSPVTSHWRYRNLIDHLLEQYFVKLEAWLHCYRTAI